jgi:hypothetical protein
MATVFQTGAKNKFLTICVGQKMFQWIKTESSLLNCNLLEQVSLILVEIHG